MRRTEQATTPITLDEALRGHELDVAGLELSTPQQQADNVHKWISRVNADERKEGQRLIDAMRKRYRVRNPE